MPSFIWLFCWIPYLNFAGLLLKVNTQTLQGLFYIICIIFQSCVFFIISVNCNLSFRKKYWLKLTRNAWLCWCSVIVGLLTESSLLSSVCVDIQLRPSDTAFLRKKLAFTSQFLVYLQVWTAEKYFRKWEMFYRCGVCLCVHEDTHKHCLKPE